MKSAPKKRTRATPVFLLSPLAWACTLALAQGPGLPTGGTIVKGSGSIGGNATGLVVKQTSASLVADWQSFSIDAGKSVRFVQPSSSAVALNRVLGTDPSRILGSLTANGHVYLQNAAGVYFAPGAQVDVGALVATTLDVDVDRLLGGHLSLSGDAGRGAVRNEGTISAASGGYVVLAAPQVENAGSISAPRGTAALVAGSAVEIDATGAGLLSISVPVAAIGAHLANSGRIAADGGSVALLAAATDAALETVMQVGGVVRARSIEQRDGEIVLAGGDSGVVRVTGILDASGGAGETGGTVKVLGERVGLLDDARIDVSGDLGGGTILVGGNYQGRGPEANSQVAVVGAGVVLDASAGSRGDGGKVVVWSDHETAFQGRIAARGGAAGGDGGFAEVSGKHLDFAGSVDQRAAHGQAGRLLLDPTNITLVGDGESSPPGAELTDTLVGAGDPDNQPSFGGSYFTASSVAALLENSSVTLQATNEINVQAEVNVPAGGAATTLTLEAGRAITISADMTLNNASLVATVPNVGSAGIAVLGTVRSLGSVTLAGPSIAIDGTVAAPRVELEGNASEDTLAGSIVAETLDLSGSSFNLDGPNRIGSLHLSADAVSVTLTEFEDGAGTTIQGDVSGNLSVSFDGDLFQDEALSVGNDFSIAGNGVVFLDNAGNTFGGTVNFDLPASITLNATGPLRIGGRAGGSVNVVTDDVLTLGVPGINTTGTLISLTSASFVDGSDTGVALQASGTGGRFIVRTSDSALDDFGSIRRGSGSDQVNHIVYSTWAGADPASGNVYFISATGDLAAPTTDRVAPVKTYDQGTAFDYAQTGSAAGGDLFGETLSFSSYSVAAGGNFTGAGAKNAGTNKPYTVADSYDVTAVGAEDSLSGATGGEIYYGLKFTGFNGTDGTIDRLLIGAAGIVGVNRAYDGTTAVGLTGTPTGILAGDAVTVSGAGSMADKNAGTGKAVTIDTVTLGGADAGNYEIGTEGATTTVDITPLAITATGIAALDRVYDGTTAVALNTAGAALAGVIAGDTVNLATGGVAGAVANKNVGTAKPVTITGLALTGTDATNYTVNDASGATATITPLAITATGIAGVNRIYDGTTAVALNTAAAALAGVITGDTVNLATAGAAGAVANKNVGAAKPVTITGLALTGTDAGNYTVTEASGATATITPLAITVTGLAGVNRVYDGTTSVALNTAGAMLGAGVVGGDTVNLVTSGAAGTVANKNVGTDKPVTITGLSLTGADAANYAVSDASGATATITPLAITATGLAGIDRVYDGTTVVGLNATGAALSGVIAGDAVTLSTTAATGALADKNVGTAKPVTIAGLALSGADAGNYTVSDASNATATIAPRSLIVTGIDGVDRAYDGTTAVALDTSGASFSGLVEGDGVGLAGGSGALADKHVGTDRPVTIAGLALTGADAGNYTLLDRSEATATISALTLTASGLRAIDRVADGTTAVQLDASGATLLGLVAGDAVALNVSNATGSVASPEVGQNRPVTVSGLSLTGADAGDYLLSETVFGSGGANLLVSILVPGPGGFDARAAFEAVRQRDYLQALVDAQEPFRRAMLEALLSGFGKENIRKPLGRGLVFETGLAAPAIDSIEPAAPAASCTAGASLDCQ